MKNAGKRCCSAKKNMSFTEIMQAIEACRVDDCDKCLLNGGPIAGWFQEDVPDCYTVLLKNAEKQLRRTGDWWRWDDIFRVYRCTMRTAQSAKGGNITDEHAAIRLVGLCKMDDPQL